MYKDLEQAFIAIVLLFGDFVVSVGVMVYLDFRKPQWKGRCL